MKIFLSADIEGTCGIAHWDETSAGKPLYDRYAVQMTREVAAACEGALAGGAAEILVKDAHDTARNIMHDYLPEQVKVLRGWARHPYSMMAGLDDTFDGAIFTGYHSAAQMETNPLSHTMNLHNNYVKINGELASELMINSLTAASLGVPVLMVTGDAGLCGWMRDVCPWVQTVPVNEGHGNATLSIHPNLAVQRIREAAEQAVSQIAQAQPFPMPQRFVVDINYKDHPRAEGAHWYPGCEKLDARTVRYTSDNWFDVLTMFHFIL